MENRYEAARTAVDSTHASELLGLEWYVRENHSDGQSSWIKCYCFGEASAREIAAAMNHMNQITSHQWENRL